MVLNFQEPAVDANLSQVTYVLDTPLLMAVMDLTGEKEVEFATGLVEDMKSKGASLAVFEHSLDELRDNIKAVRNHHLEKRSFGETARRLRQSSFYSYFEEVRKDPEFLLRKLGIKVLSDIKSSTSQKLFSDEDESSFFDTLGTFSNQKAQERDASSISQIMRHRNGVKTKQKEFYKCRYIFVTENSFIADSAMEFLVKNEILGDTECPPAFSSRYISGLLWVLFGGKGQELSKQLLLANCAKALEPNNDVVKKMNGFLEAMNPHQAELFDAVMGDERAGQYLMQYSLGDATLITEENSLPILEELKESLSEKYKAEMAETIASLEIEHSEKVAEAVAKVENNFTEQLEQRDKRDEETRGKLYEADQTILRQSGELEELKNQLGAVIDENLSAQKKAEKDLINKIEQIMCRAILAQRRITGLIVFSFFLCLVLSGFYLSEPISNPIVLVVVIMMPAVLGVLAFWKVPEVVFGKSSNAYRNYYFQKLLSQKGIQVDMANVHLDWKRTKAEFLEH